MALDRAGLNAVIPVNAAPRVVSAAGTAATTLTVVALPSRANLDGQQAAYALVGASPPSSLVVNDCAALQDASADNEILSIPFSALAPGQVLAIPATSTGLTISAIPPAMAVSINIP